MDDSLSYELADAPPVCVPTSLRSLSLAEMRVIALLREREQLFVGAESEFSVDRRAIAGAVAWEGLENNKWWTNALHRFGVGRSAGWGKEHLKSAFFFGSVQSTWCYAVERRGLLPSQSDDGRRALMADPAVAVRYIGATMDLIALIYEDAGSPGVCTPNLRNNPVILTNVYQGTDKKLPGSEPEKWATHVKAIDSSHVLRAENSMALWLTMPRNMTLVEDGVGKPVEMFGPPGKS